jgi:starch-binding outer membrane protein SusE/F
MKKILSIGFAVCISILFAESCKKKETKAVLSDSAVKPVLSFSTPFADTVFLNQDSASVQVANLSWTAADFGFASATRYAIEMIQKGGNWDDAKSINMDQSLAKSLTNKDLNNLVIDLDVPMESVGVVWTRIKATVQGSNVVTYSEPKEKIIKTYSTKIVYNKLWIPGDYQGWNHDTGSVQVLEELIKGSGKFEGIAEKSRKDGTKSGGGFKFTPAANWDYDFGDAGTTGTPETGSGVVGTKYLGTAGSNFNLADGTYKIMVDTVGKTWSYSLQSWGIVGDATPLGWPTGSGADPSNTQDAQNLRYNQATKMYEITIDLKGGKSILFRKNDQWAEKIALASGLPKNDPLPIGAPVVGSGGGEDIGIKDDGNYTFKVDPSTFTIIAIKN